LTHLIGKDPRIVARALRDDIHRFPKEMLSDDHARLLGVFVTRGQHDPFHYIDAANRAKGDAGLGERVFQNVCAACHGFDGKAINFKTKDDPEYVGTQANEAPWETLHKVRNGHPGAPMPALRFLPIQTVVDIVAYAQSLPVK
jgi:thiosulfate dehydrogenase